MQYMTAEEVSERYHIPIKILEEYRQWGLCSTVQKVMDDWRYTDEDLERMSLIMTLHDIGFKPAEVEHYMNLVLEGKQKDAERLKMLDKIREKALDEIHFREKQLSRLDYLRYEIRNRQDKKQAEECLKSISK